MRDILTIVAGLVIAVLVAVLAIPPLVDWPSQRAWVDRAISRAVGAEARTAGALEIRILPSPRIRMDRLRIGPAGPDGRGRPDSASLDAMFVKAELALTHLLSGEVRFLDTRVGRAEIKLPAGAGGDWSVPASLAEPAAGRRAWAFEDLSVRQFLVTTSDPRTGRTDQAYAENVRVQAGSFAGPWRLEGEVGAVPFQVATGEFGDGLSAPVKIGAGGGARPRLEIDGRLEFRAEADGRLRPRLVGTGKLAGSFAAAAPSGRRVPATASAGIKAGDRVVELDGVAIEIGDGIGAARLTGTGSVRLDEPRLALTLAGRRIDLAAVRDPGAWPAFAAASGDIAALLPPTDLALRLDNLSFGPEEEWTGVTLGATLAGSRLAIADLAASGPGRSTLRASGEVAIGDGPIGSGRFALSARDGDRFARLLEALGLRGSAVLIGDRALEASGDVAATGNVVSVRNARLVVGESTASGTVRFTAAEGGGRARLDALLALTGLDVASLPELVPSFVGLRDLDVGLILDARDVAYGNAARGGRITGRVATDGAGIAIERLEVRDLAGAEADLAGRIAPDGIGRIEGRLRAARAAPLVDLFGRPWLGGLSRLIPEPVRASAVDLAVTVERAGGGIADAAGRPLRTRLFGKLAGGPVEAEAATSGSRATSLTVAASVEDGRAWLPGSGDDARARAPARLQLLGRRDRDGRLALEGSLDLAGLRVASLQPFLLGGNDDRLEDGAAEGETADASRLLARLGIAAEAPLPVKLKAEIARTAGLAVQLGGNVAGAEVSAALSWSESGSVEGRATLARASLPALASALALDPGRGGRAGEIWSSARFRPREPSRVEGSVRVSAARLDLGSGFSGTDATFLLATRPDGVRFGDLDAAFAEGRLKADLTFDRQGGLASVVGEGQLDGVRLDALVGPPVRGGRVTARLRFGSSGESPAGLAANLGGVSEVTLTDLRVAEADPGAVGRVASAALRTDDPLATRNWAALLGAELAKGELTGGRVASSGSLVGGALRLGPLSIGSDAGRWTGTATIDLRTGSLDARGSLQAVETPRNWVGPPPSIGLGWSGPVARPNRSVDPGPLVNGLAAVVLARELDRIETFELDAAERARRNSRVEMERQRRIAAEEARQARLREEAAERLREAERQRQEAERRRRDDERQRDEADRRAPVPPARPDGG